MIHNGFLSGGAGEVGLAPAVLSLPVPPGLSVEEGRLLAATGSGTLEISQLQPPGKARMDTAAFLRGYRGPLAWTAS